MDHTHLKMIDRIMDQYTGLQGNYPEDGMSIDTIRFVIDLMEKIMTATRGATFPAGAYQKPKADKDETTACSDEELDHLLFGVQNNENH